MLAGATKGLHSSALELVVVERDSDSFEQAAAKLNMGSFEWAMLGLCKLKEQTEDSRKDRGVQTTGNSAKVSLSSVGQGGEGRLGTLLPASQ